MSETASRLDEEGEPARLRLSAPFRNWVKSLRRKRDEDNLRETLEELIEETPQPGEDNETASERQLLSNVLKLHERSIRNVMIPRTDIIAIGADSSFDETLSLVSREEHSRYPVYDGDLDTIIGVIHIKDILPYISRRDEFVLRNVVREPFIVAPSMSVLSLLSEMRQSRRHMALVVDEFGGIDGLLTIEDLVEEIIGEIEDEHDESGPPQLVEKPDGSLMADGRLSLHELEIRTGPLLDEEERDSVDTLGGLVLLLAGRVPGKCEIIRHKSGIEFEMADADARRIRRVRIRNLPASADPSI